MSTSLRYALAFVLMACSSALAQTTPVTHRKTSQLSVVEQIDKDAEIALGRMLFFDKRLSIDDTISCASCHKFDRGTADSRSVSLGVKRQKGDRNTPPIFNLEDDGPNTNFMFWDGVTFGLDGQADRPLRNPKEMGNVRSEDVPAKLNRIAGYRQLAHEIYGRDLTLADITRALGNYQRTLIVNDSPWDRYQAGDPTAMTAAQLHGRQVFENLGCTDCHAGKNMRVANKFANLGVAFVFNEQDRGLGNIDRAQNRRDSQGNPDNRDGFFKVPTLRNLADTAPYGHKGEFATLDDVLDHLNRGGANLAGRADPKTNPLILSFRGQIPYGPDRDDLKDYLLNGCRGTVPFDVQPELPK